MNIERYDSLRDLVRESFSEQSQVLVDKALEYAEERLSGLIRYDGTPMLDHGVSVAQIAISEIGLGRNSTIASILHDVVRIAHKNHDENILALTDSIKELFGEEVVGI